MLQGTTTPVRRVVPALFAAVALSALGGCGLGGPAYAPPPRDAVVVEMTSTLSFEPDTLTIKAGDTVEWRNVSLFTHTVTLDPALADDPNDASLPAGARTFRSGPIAPGEILRHTFTEPGVYRYFCEPHEGFNMLGALTVEPPA